GPIGSQMTAILTRLGTGCRQRRNSLNWTRSLGHTVVPWALAGLGLGAMLVDPKKGTGVGKEPCNEPPAAPAATGRRAGL
ncbi:hypothetical protein GOODEAATRI_023765, partial [Goodea atripinnis]